MLCSTPPSGTAVRARTPSRQHSPVGGMVGAVPSAAIHALSTVSVSRREVNCSYRMLERCRWRRRKGSYVWRTVLRLSIAVYRLPGAPMLANTSCTALIGAASLSTSSIPLPPSTRAREPRTAVPRRAVFYGVDRARLAGELRPALHRPGRASARGRLVPPTSAEEVPARRRGLWIRRGAPLVTWDLEQT